MGMVYMIIQRFDAAVSLKSRNGRRIQSSTIVSNPLIPKKQIGLKDLLYHSHLPNNPRVYFGNGKVEKARTFSESVPKYFRLPPDKKQVEAAASLYMGDDTVVTAPTGTGKTLIAEYAINKNLAEGKNTFYTTPLKALSNEKYRDFCNLYGHENVGLLTGDVKINPNAKVVVMTTEIYRNMLLGDDEQNLARRTKNLGTVIYDEFHMMNDPERGEVWETSIMYTPPKVQQLALSATVGNDRTVEGWFQRILAEKKSADGVDSPREARLVHVPSSERHVPLKFFVFDEGASSIKPLILEKYSLAQIKEAAKPDSKTPLFDKQKDALVELAKKAGKEETVESGIQVLESVVKNPEGEIEHLEDALVSRLGMDVPEAQRTALLLSDKSTRRMNPALVHPSNVEGKSEARKVVSSAKIEEIFEDGRASEYLIKGLKQLSGKKNSSRAGLERLASLTEGQEIAPEVFTAKLVERGIEAGLAGRITERLTVKVQEQKPARARAVMKPVVSLGKMVELLDSKKAPHQMIIALNRLGNKQSPERGLRIVADLTEGKELTPEAFQNELVFTKGMDKDLAALITSKLTVAVEKTDNRPQELEVLDVLEQKKMLPAIFFKFSQGGCDDLREEFLGEGRSLLSDEEQAQARKIIDAHLDEGNFLGTDERPRRLLSGTAVHHAGKMPGHKALVEKLAQQKLSRAVFATDTLGAGINVPARTTVLTQLTKFAGLDEFGEAEYRRLSANEFHQMAGRAGRRGKDPIGYVVIMPDKDNNTPEDIYRLVTASADNLRSNFQPTYGFISHFAALRKTTEGLASAVDKSFLRESLDPAEVNPDQVVDDTKAKFVNMAKVLTMPEMECFTGEEGNLAPTLKGTIVSKARGMNGLLFANIIMDSPLDTLEPHQLAAVACSLTEGNSKNSTLPYKQDAGVEDVLGHIESIRQKITTVEEANGIPAKEEVSNFYAMPFIQEWVKSPEEDSREGWMDIVSHSLKSAKNFGEGDLFKTVNRTVDVVQQMREVADFVAKSAEQRGGMTPLAEKMRKISDTAKEALRGLKKSPIADTIQEASHAIR